MRGAKRDLDERRAVQARPIARPRQARLQKAKRRLDEELAVERAANTAYEHYRAHGRQKNGRRLGAAPKPYTPPATPTGKINLTDLDSRNLTDRELNCALHTIVLTRLKHDPAARAYAARRAAEGKTPREIKRCLKRYVARHLFRVLKSTAPTPLIERPQRAHTLGICSQQDIEASRRSAWRL